MGIVGLPWKRQSFVGVWGGQAEVEVAVQLEVEERAPTIKINKQKKVAQHKCTPPYTHTHTHHHSLQLKLGGQIVNLILECSIRQREVLVEKTRFAMTVREMLGACVLVMINQAWVTFNPLCLRISLSASL